MNTNEAKKILIKQGWVNKIEFVKGKKKSQDQWIIKTDWSNHSYSNREFIKLAKTYTSENNQNTCFKRNLKEDSHSKERSSERNAIANENFDAIPQNGVVKTGNPWDWD
jgi:hypothetical protein